MIQKDGFDFVFDSTKCDECGGKCCIGESGYVFVKESEIEKIAEFLGLSVESFGKKYLRSVGNRYSLIEKPHPSGKACVFFDDEKKCTIYSLRPQNCRDFPFWGIFKTNSQGAFRECMGVLKK